jgi:hypothetical protein
LFTDDVAGVAAKQLVDGDAATVQEVNVPCSLFGQNLALEKCEWYSSIHDVALNV